MLFEYFEIYFIYFQYSKLKEFGNEEKTLECKEENFSFHIHTWNTNIHKTIFIKICVFGKADWLYNM